MSVTVRRNFGSLRNLTLLVRDDWEAIGRLARERILMRTAQGRDVNEQAFAPFSDSYAKQREREGLSVAQPTLELSGEMLRSIQVEAFGDRVELHF